jgi:hypothetical protein
MNKVTDYKISDAQTGLMAFGRRYLEVFELHGNYNPPQQLLLDANYKHMRYTEVPVVFHKRTKGKSFVNLKYPIYVFVNMFRVLVYAIPLRTFGTIGILCIGFSILYLILSLMAKKYNWGLSILFIDEVSLAFLIVGIQSFFFGFLADLIIHKRR